MSLFVVFCGGLSGLCGDLYGGLYGSLCGGLSCGLFDCLGGLFQRLA